MTVAQVAERTNLSRAAARRCLLTLVNEGYAVTNGKYFSLSPKVLNLGYAFLSSRPFWESARPIVDEVVRKTGETTSIAVLDNADVIFAFVARLPGRILILNLGVGSRLPAYATAVGRVLLGGLPDQQLDAVLSTIEPKKLTKQTVASRKELRAMIDRARNAGWALADGELEDGIRSIAVPIRDPSGHVSAALGITSSSSKITAKQMTSAFLPILREAAGSLSGISISRTA